MAGATMTQERDAGFCPMHHPADARAQLAPESWFTLPRHRGAFVQYATREEGTPELRLFYGDKEVSFDEPDLFAFGEMLVQQPRFCGHDAMAWGTGYDWSRLEPLLSQLVDEGVLLLNATGLDDDEKKSGRSCPSPLPVSPTLEAHSWHDCAAITAELAGRPVETGYLELVMPIFRIAHAAVDQDGRQVGEANVFPRPLRLNVPTEWMSCIYPGSRYESEKPMNVTALKAMRNHWRPMMATLQRVRAAYLTRFPDAQQGWTVGHLERLATAVLALPTFQLMRVEGTTENGDLHPVLSSVFRVTDGLRMVMHQMLFIPVGEPTRSPLDPMTSAEVYAYAERNHSFQSDYGVCAGPKAMVEEFLRVIMDGDDSRGFSAEPLPQAVEEALGDLDKVLDYAFLGLQAYAAGFSLWPAMTRAYEQLFEAAATWAVAGSPHLAHWVDRLKAHHATLKSRTYLAQEAWRFDREAVYADMYGQCGRGLSQPQNGPSLEAQINGFHARDEAALRQELQHLLVLRFGTRHREAVETTSQIVLSFLIRIQAILTVGCAVQDKINGLLGRETPIRPFEAADMDIHNLLQGEDSQRLPFLLDEIRTGLGIDVRITPTEIMLMPVDVPLRHAG